MTGKTQIASAAAVIIAVAAVVLFKGCNDSREGSYKHISGMAWGTVYNITYRSTDDLSAVVDSVIEHVNFTLSPFVENSEISRINRNECDSAGADFRELMKMSQHVCSISHGAFDPTIAPLVNLWGFGYDKRRAKVPNQQEIDSALLLIGIRECKVMPNGRIVKKTAGTQFNFSAIAKGYGVDMIARALASHGCKDYMVEVGGEIALSGKNPRNDKWHIQVDAPVFAESGIEHERLALLPLTDCGMATSGNYRNFHRNGDSIVGHTISSITGYPIITSTLSATVIAPSCAFADALATSVMAMPDTAQAFAMLRSLQPQVRAIVVMADSDSIRVVNIP